MHRFFIFNKQDNPTQKIVPTEDVLHQVKHVLRIRENEFFVCIYENLELVVKLEGDVFIVDGYTELELDKKRELTLIQGIPTTKKVSLIIQKAVELDVDHIYLWQAHRSTSKMEDFTKKEERLKKIIVEACEQTRRNDIPTLHFIEVLEDYDFSNSHIITMYEKEENYSMREALLSRKTNNITVVIGPEGGLEEMEVGYLIDQGSKVATFGKNILRTETAAIAALSVLNYEVGSE